MKKRLVAYLMVSALAVSVLAGCGGKGKGGDAGDAADAGTGEAAVVEEAVETVDETVDELKNEAEEAEEKVNEFRYDGFAPRPAAEEKPAEERKSRFGNLDFGDKFDFTK